MDFVLWDGPTMALIIRPTAFLMRSSWRPVGVCQEPAAKYSLDKINELKSCGRIFNGRCLFAMRRRRSCSKAERAMPILWEISVSRFWSEVYNVPKCL